MVGGKRENNIRDYGLGNVETTGPPEVLSKMEGVCSHCGGETLYLISVEVSNAMLKGGGGTGRYVGCAACPYASPMMASAKGSKG